MFGIHDDHVREMNSCVKQVSVSMQGNYKIEYNSLDKGGGLSFMKLSRELKMMDSVKATVPRTAYLGSLFVRIKGGSRKLYLVESTSFVKK